MPAGPVPFRAIADSTYDWETWIDGAGQVRWVNPAVERFTGMTADECVTAPDFPLCVVLPEDRTAMRARLARAALGESGNDEEFRVVHRDGSVRWAAMSFQPLVDEGVARGFRTSVRDIDERKRFEDRLRQAERDASRAAEDRSDLLATLSHELRSPLHCIAGYADILRARVEDPELRRHASIVVDQSESVLRHVEDLLRFVAGDATSAMLAPEPFDVAALLRDVVEVSTPRARPGVRVRFEGPEGVVRVLGDRERVRQIATNLVDNALRYTTAGDVTVTLERTVVGHVRLSVVDTGPGMSETLRARARQPFVQGPGTRAGGVGLGLAIVDRLVRAMEGRFELTSALGQGTRAVVELPLPRARAPRRGSASSGPAPTPTTCRVLVVDDSDPARELVVTMVRALGHQADEATQGALAVAASRAVPYDLVLLDYHMPDWDGVTTASLLLDACAPHRPFIVLLTANVLIAERAGELPPSVDRVVTKPLRLARLRELVADAVRDTPRARERRSPRTEGRRRSAPFESGPLEELLSLPARFGPSARLTRLEEALAEGFSAVASHAAAAERCAEAAHALKGLLLSVGAADAAQRAARVEASARAGAPSLPALRRLAASRASVFTHLDQVAATLGIRTRLAERGVRVRQQRARASSAKAPSGSSSR